MVRPSSKPAVGPERARWRHTGHTPRRNAGLAAYENVLARAGLAPVAGVDEAGRGACAGPLVIAAVVLDNATIRRMPGLADSKLLTPEEREDAYRDIMRWALDWNALTTVLGPQPALLPIVPNRAPLPPATPDPAAGGGGRGAPNQ